MRIIQRIGAKTIASIESVGRLTLFFTIGAIHMVVLPFQYKKVLDHTRFIGSKSIVVILVTGFFTGMVIGLQGYYSLVRFGSEEALGSAVALSMIREMGPVFTAIMVTARAGSAMAAEIGVMRISEQIDALRTMHINPVRFLFSPRLTASIISFPLLTAIFDIVGIFGGYVTGCHAGPQQIRIHGKCHWKRPYGRYCRRVFKGAGLCGSGNHRLLLSRILYSLFQRVRGQKREPLHHRCRGSILHSDFNR